MVGSGGNVYVTTKDNGLMRSTNGGASWLKVLGAGINGGAVDQAADIEIASNGDIYCSLGLFSNTAASTDGIYKSTNGGNAWVKLAGGLPVAGFQRIELAVAPSNPNRLFAMFQHDVNLNCSGIYRSDDAGVTWVALGLPVAVGMANFCNGQAFYNLIAAVDPNDDDRVFVGGIDLFFLTMREEPGPRLPNGMEQG
ncbi:MAG: sialidase family protein [Bacteroidia bacterium]